MTFRPPVTAGGEPIRVLELRSVWGTGGGPEKTILLGAAAADPSRFAITVCYIRDERDPVFGIDQKAAAVGVDYIEIREAHSLDWRIWPKLRALVQGRRIEIVHAHEYKTDLLALLLARSDRIVPLATVHGWTGETKKDRAYYWADKRLLARYPRLIAVSGEIRQQLVRAGAPPDRVLTVLNGIDEGVFTRRPERVAPARAALGLQPDQVVVGAVGRLETQKRFDLLLEAFARLAPAYPGLRGLIAGDGSLKPALEAQIDALGLRNRVQLLGHCDDVIAFHHAIDLFVQSSQYEGTPNAVLEAMALGSPLVATDAGGTRELVESGVHGLIVPARDVGALVRGIALALDEPGQARAWAAAARQRVETELSFTRRRQRVEEVYEDLVGRRGGRTSTSEVA